MSGQYRNGRGRLSAFSIVELMVSISILALLAILGMGIAGQMRQRADSTLCLQNLRQLGLGAELYLADHSQTYWPHTYNGDQGWYAQFKGGVARGPLAYLDYDLARGDATRKKTVMDCPAMKMGYGGLVLDYMYNGGLGDLSPLKAPQVSRPGSTVLFMTGYFYRFRWPQATHPLSPLTSSLNPDVRTYAAFVHPGDRANIIFVDGHCESLTASEIVQRGLNEMSDPLHP